MFKKYIGTREFYRRAFSIAIPIIIQNGITNFVSLLDNIMVGQVGTMPMSGVSIMNQLIFVFNLCIFGATSGAGIFTAQFRGSGDNDGIRYTFRFKILIAAAISVGGISLFLTRGSQLAGLFLMGEGSAADAAQALEYGMDYLKIMLWGLIPFALSNAYSSTLRETDEAVIPMIGGITAVIVNLVLNYALIFGHFGAPEMGVAGAAVATVVSRYVELLLVAGWTHLNPGKNPFIVKAFRSAYIPLELLKQITVKGMPLLVNEALWSGGMTTLNQCYSTCGLAVVPAMNICTTLFNLSSVVFLSMGSVVGIIMGQMLGARLPESELRDTNRKLIFLSVITGCFCTLIMAAMAPLFPRIYNTTDEVRLLAGWLIVLAALTLPIHAYLNGAYFTLRSGGKTFVTFLFDCCFMWVFSVPAAFFLTRFTPLHILMVYALVQILDCLKCVLGWYLLKKGSWIQNLAV